MLVNGKADEMLYQRHLIATSGLPFAELKQRSLINKRARAAGSGPGFFPADPRRSAEWEPADGVVAGIRLKQNR